MNLKKKKKEQEVWFKIHTVVVGKEWCEQLNKTFA